MTDEAYQELVRDRDTLWKHMRALENELDECHDKMESFNSAIDAEENYRIRMKLFGVTANG